MRVTTTSLFHYSDLIKNLIAKDIQLRYQGAALGLFWSLLHPLAMIGLYAYVFTTFFKSNLDNYALYLVTGLLHWSLFSGIIASSCDFLTANAGLIKKVHFPRLTLPIAGLLFNLVLWLVTIGVFAMLYPFMGGKISLALLAYPLALSGFILFIFGLSLVLAVLHVEFKDLKHLIDVALLFLFWLTPIVYDYTLVPEEMRQWFAISPLVDYMLIFQNLLYAGQLPTQNITLAAAFWTVTVFTFGLWFFHRRSPHLVEHL